jgi:Right handed beta helix region
VGRRQMSLILKTINRYIVQRSVVGIPVGVTLPTAPSDIIYVHPTIAALIAAPIPAATNVSKRVLGCTVAGDCEMPIYRWDASSTAVHDGALVVKPGSISAGNPGRYLAIHNNQVNCKWYGAVGNNTADDTGPMQNALNGAAGKTLIIPKGTYLVFQLAVPSNTKIKAENDSAIRFVGGNCFVCNSIENFSVSGLRFEGDNTQIAVFAGRSKNITVKNCTASCRLFAGSLALPYASVTDADLNKNIKILNNTCTGTNKLLGDAAIYFIYCDEALAAWNTVKKYAHGIAWWGGSADHLQDGALANPRKTKHIKIIGNTVFDIGENGTGGGGIWGSMGEDVIVSNNDVSLCEDVGIDFEGTYGGVASNNVVRDCVKGCLATFFWNTKITFSKNIVRVSNSNYPVWRNYNSAQQGDKSRDISLEGNQFFSTGVAVGLCDCQGGSCSDLTISGNKFHNIYLSIDAANMGAVTIKDNEIITDIQANSRAGIAVIGLTGEKEILTIENNKILSKASQPVGSSGIFVNHNHFNSPQVSIIKNNLCHGFIEDITCVLTSANASIGGTFILQNNIGTAGVISVSRAVNAGVAPTALKLNNMRIDGVPS